MCDMAVAARKTKNGELAKASVQSRAAVSPSSAARNVAYSTSSVAAASSGFISCGTPSFIASASRAGQPGFMIPCHMPPAALRCTKLKNSNPGGGSKPMRPWAKARAWNW